MSGRDASIEAHEQLVSQLASTADEQLSSAFFTKLPLEVRNMIYTEFWRTSGLRQHVTTDPDAPLSAPIKFIHTPCITTPGEPDKRYANYKASGAGPFGPWKQRLRSEWTIHWTCQEALENQQHPSCQWSPFLPVLSSCKRFYLEGIASILDTVTFALTDTQHAIKFLSRFPGTHARSLDLAILMTASLTDFYLRPANDKAVIVGPSRRPTTVNAARNPWETLCKSLVDLSLSGSLRELCMWLDSKDLRPWHKSVAETRVFARLTEVQGVNHFVLYLPEIPEGEESTELKGCFLGGSSQGEASEETPFVLERGERPNSFEIYISSRARHMGNRLHNEVPLITSRNFTVLS